MLEDLFEAVYATCVDQYGSPYKAPAKHHGDYAIGNYKTNSYEGDKVKSIAHGVKEKDLLIRNMSARQMADYFIEQGFLGEDDILVPAPQHTGKADYTLQIANYIADKTGCKVADILICDPHETLYDQKKSRKVKVTTGDLRLKDGIDVPKGNLYFLDNVIATGTTYNEVKRQVPGIKPLPYALSTRYDLKQDDNGEWMVESNNEGLLFSNNDLCISNTEDFYISNKNKDDLFTDIILNKKKDKDNNEPTLNLELNKEVNNEDEVLAKPEKEYDNIDTYNKYKELVKLAKKEVSQFVQDLKILKNIDIKHNNKYLCVYFYNDTPYICIISLYDTHSKYKLNAIVDFIDYYNGPEELNVENIIYFGWSNDRVDLSKANVLKPEDFFIRPKGINGGVAFEKLIAFCLKNNISWESLNNSNYNDYNELQSKISKDEYNYLLNDIIWEQQIYNFLKNSDNNILSLINKGLYNINNGPLKNCYHEDDIITELNRIFGNKDKFYPADIILTSSDYNIENLKKDVENLKEGSKTNIQHLQNFFFELLRDGKLVGVSLKKFKCVKNDNLQDRIKIVLGLKSIDIENLDFKIKNLEIKEDTFKYFTNNKDNFILECVHPEDIFEPENSFFEMLVDGSVWRNKPKALAGYGALKKSYNMIAEKKDSFTINKAMAMAMKYTFSGDNNSEDDDVSIIPHLKIF